MRDERGLFRRAVLGKGAALGVLLAGCSGTEGPTETPSDTPTSTETSVGGGTETPDGTGTPTGETALERFAYPQGATRAGITAEQLLGTHESTVLDSGSVTVTVEGETRYANRTESFDQFGVFDADDVYRRDVGDQLAERVWSPADESVAYVRMDANNRRRFRIDDEVPVRRGVAQLDLFAVLLAGATWGEAVEVVETFEGESAVAYEAAGVADESRLLELLTGDAVTGLTGRVVVTEGGYVHEATYDLTVRRGEESVEQTATATVFSLGETDVSEPSWANTARREGTRFDADITPTEDFVRLKLVNGADLPAGTTGQVTAGQSQSGTAAFGERVTVGDTVYLGFNEAGRLFAEVNDQPLTDVELGSSASAVVELDRFVLYRGTVTT